MTFKNYVFLFIDQSKDQPSLVLAYKGPLLPGEDRYDIIRYLNNYQEPRENSTKQLLDSMLIHQICDKDTPTSTQSVSRGGIVTNL